MSQMLYEDIEPVSWQIDRQPDFNILFYLGDDTSSMNTNTKHYLDNISIHINNIFKMEKEIEKEKENKVYDCCLCMEEKVVNDMCQLNCEHLFCIKCIKCHLKQNVNTSLCPLCRQTIHKIEIQNETAKAEFIENS